ACRADPLAFRLLSTDPSEPRAPGRDRNLLQAGAIDKTSGEDRETNCLEVCNHGKASALRIFASDRTQHRIVTLNDLALPLQRARLAKVGRKGTREPYLRQPGVVGSDHEAVVRGSHDRLVEGDVELDCC